MQGFRRMKIERGSPGRTEGCCDLARNDSALAHAGYNDASTAGVQAIYRPCKILGHRSGNAFCQITQRLRFNTDYLGTSGVHVPIILAATRQTAGKEWADSVLSVTIVRHYGRESRQLSCRPTGRGERDHGVRWWPRGGQ